MSIKKSTILKVHCYLSRCYFNFNFIYLFIISSNLLYTTAIESAEPLLDLAYAC